MINEDNIKYIFGSAVKDFRIQKGISREKLAEMIDVQPQAIAKIETGKRFVSSKVIAGLCNVFNVEPYVFFLKPAQTYTPESLDHISKIDSKLDKIYNLINKTKK